MEAFRDFMAHPVGYTSEMASAAARTLSDGLSRTGDVISGVCDEIFERMTAANVLKGGYVAATVITGYLALKGLGMLLTAASVASVFAGMFFTFTCGPISLVLAAGLAGYGYCKS